MNAEDSKIVYLKSVEELQHELGIDHTPTVKDIIKYLEEKSDVKHLGKMSTNCYVNKDALRLAALFLTDAYIYDKE